jgi:Flp pilus assembly pilin Flp
MGGGEEMSAMWLRFHNRLVDERGTVYVEYVVISALAVLVILGAIQFFFGSLATLFQRLAGALTQIG